MHSFIICRGGKKERIVRIATLIAELRNEKPRNLVELTQAQSPDTLLVRPDPSISIDDIRSLIGKLQLKPFAAKNTLAIIEDASRMTIPAQHALLKTLEEPAGTTYLILELENPNLIIPTIRSRCQIIMVPGTPERVTVPLASFLELTRETPGRRLQMIASIIKDDDPQLILRSLLDTLRVLMRKDHHWVDAVRVTQEALHDLSHNVNPSFVLEHFALNLRAPGTRLGVRRKYNPKERGR